MAAAGLGIITSKNDNQKAQANQHKKLHAGPIIIIGFFVILAMVDATIVTLANKGASEEFVRKFLPEPRRQSAQDVTSAFPGTVANDYQKKYDLYNNYIGQLKNQHERGWHVKDGWIDKPVEGKPALFRINVLDKQGNPITGAQVTISFLRPSNKSMDVNTQLPEQNAGFYGQTVTLPAPGLWDLLITIKKGDDIHEVKGDTQIQAAS
jgi:nitrogen fixation protein FixH